MLENERRQRSLARQAARHLFDGHAALKLVVDLASGVVLDANPAALDFYGYEAEALIGRPVDALGVLTLDRLLLLFERALANERYVVSLRQRLASGDVRDVEAFLSEVEVDGRRVLYIIGRDATVQRRDRSVLRGAERSLRSFLDCAPVMMGIVEVHGDDVLHVSDNEKAADFFGTTPEAMAGRLASEMGAPDCVRARWVQAYNESALRAEPVLFEYDHAHPRGMLRLRVVVNCIGPSEGGVPRFSYVAEDVTAEYTLEASSKQTAQLLRAVFEQAYQFMGLLDARGYVVEMNRSALTFLGCSLEDLVGHPLWQCEVLKRHPPLQRRLRSAIEQAATGTFVRHEVKLTDMDGRPRALDVSIKPVRDAAGPVTLLVVEGRDVTDLRHVRKALRTKSAEFERIFTATPDAVIFTGPDRTVRRMNPAAERLFGYASEEVEGQTSQTIYADEAAFEAAFEAKGRKRFNAAADPALEPYRVQYRRKDGSTFIGESVGVPVHEEEGALLGFVSIIRDVTVQDARTQAMRDSEAMLRSVIENVPVVLFVLDGTGTFALSEGRGLDALGLRPGELVGRSAFEVYAAYPALKEKLTRALDGEEVGWTVEIEGIHFETRVTPIRDAGGAITGLLGVASDITKHIETEAVLRKAKQNAEEASRAKSTFLANMSHEIRTPLTSILGFAELLADDVPPEHNDVPGLIMHGGRRLMNTLNSVLDLARIEGEQMHVRLAPVDLVAEVSATVRLLRPLAERKGLSLDVRTLADPGLVPADGAALARIINNLVGNAIKFTSQGEVVVEIDAKGGHGILRVRDTGEGIGERFLPHLFDAFRQETDGLDRRHEGSGLGLAITKRLVGLMGGSVSAASTKGEGSTFTVRLPRLLGGDDGMARLRPTLAEAGRGEA